MDEFVDAVSTTGTGARPRAVEARPRVGVRTMLARFARQALPLLAASCFAASANAAVIYSGSLGSRSASVEFSLSGTTLTIVLTNTSSADVVDPAGVLTAVFFDLASGADPLMTRTSAVSGGDTYANGTLVSSAGTVIGGEWAYLNSLTQYGANSGISSAGLGLFAAANVFPGGNLFGPADPNGIQYGITSAGDNVGTGNGGILPQPLTRSSVIFTLDNFSGSLADISNVTFQYDSALTGISLQGALEGASVPEPGTLALLGVGLVGVAFARRRNDQAASTR